MSTLKLKIGESFVDTDDLEISVVLRSFLFENKGSYLFNFTLPATESLRKEFSNFHRPSRSGPASIIKKLDLSFGLLRFTGNATISQANKEAYEISCPIDSGDLAAVLKSKLLSDIDLGGHRQESSIPIRVKASSSIDTYINLTNPEPFTHSLNIPFDVISLNALNEFDSNGLSFTASDNTSMAFMFTLNIIQSYSTSASLRIFKNSILIQSIYISGYQNTNFVIDLAINDVITWDIFLESYEDFYESIIAFDLANGSTLQILLPADSMSTNGTFLYPGSDYASFPVENPKFFDSIEDDTYQVDNISFKETYSKFFPVLNYYNDLGFPVTMSGMSEGQIFSTFNIFTPFPYLAFFIKSLAKNLGFTINNNVFENPDLNQLVIFNAFSENNLISNNLIISGYGFDLADHVPNILVSEYWLNLCYLLGIGWEYKSTSKTLFLSNLEDIMNDTNFIEFPSSVSKSVNLEASHFNGFRLKQEVSEDSFIQDNFRSLEGLNFKGSVYILNYLSGITDMQINDCYYVTMRKEYYIWNYDKEFGILNWIFHSKDFFFIHESIDKSLGETTLEITSKIFPIMLNGYDLLDHNLCAENSRHWLIPVTHQPGTFEGLPDNFSSDFSTSLLFYRGLQYDSLGKLYPLGTPDVFNYLGERVVTEGHTATLSLRWDGEFGLYNKRYKKWIDFLLRSPGTWEFSAIMTPLEISRISFLKWYTIQNHRFLIKEMNFNIYNDHISEVKILAVAK
ncbi:MAG: hypothetical protein K0B15_11765 [Lentimicrobium sp.]|nr:hypothetical protein [Lentimicrobium sp.]